MAKGDEIGYQCPRFQGQEAGLEGPVLLDKSVAGEFPVDKVVRSEDGGYPLKDIVFVPLNPAQFVRNELLVDAVPRELKEIRRINFFFDFRHLGAGTPVVLQLIATSGTGGTGAGVVSNPVLIELGQR